MVVHELDELTTEKQFRFLPRRERQGEREKRMETAARPRWCRACLNLTNGPTAGIRSPRRGHVVAMALAGRPPWPALL
jgi:hypothetical protein